jgi:hypothetical protein
MNLEDDRIAAASRRWVESVVIDLNLCPFAKRELVKNRVRFSVSGATTEEQLLTALEVELELIASNPLIETTLLIHPAVLQTFADYNQFLGVADSLLLQMKLEGIFQIASFHPDYQFDGTDPDDAENYTNRSPYPMLHLLREESLERAIVDFPDTGNISLGNIELMNSLGGDKLRALLRACLEDN